MMDQPEDILEEIQQHIRSCMQVTIGLHFSKIPMNIQEDVKYAKVHLENKEI